MTPFGDLPLIGIRKLAEEFCNQLELKTRKMLRARILTQTDFMILPFRNEFTPIGVAMPEIPRVDQIQNLTGDRPVAHGKIDPTDDRNTATSNRFTVQEVHQFNQFHDVDRAPGERNESGSDFGRFLLSKWEAVRIGTHVHSIDCATPVRRSATEGNQVYFLMFGQSAIC